jgi:hypothetical protein
MVKDEFEVFKAKSEPVRGGGYKSTFLSLIDLKEIIKLRIFIVVTSDSVGLGRSC